MTPTDMDIRDTHGPFDAHRILDAAGCALAVLDRDGIIVATNATWRSSGDALSVGDRYLAGDPSDGDLNIVLEEGIARVLAGRSARFEFEYPSDVPLGRRWYLLVVTPVEPGSRDGAVVVISDVTAHHDVQEILDASAHLDTLTGLPNRRAVTLRLHNAINRARQEGTSVSVVFLDLNGFKAVNDGLGHDVGDEVLVALGRRLKGTIRQDDMLGRWGGDEFVVVVDGGDQAVRSLADRLHGALEEPVAVRERGTVSLSLAVGAAEVHATDQPEDVLARADAAMFEAKRTGRCLVLAQGGPEEGDG